MITYTLPDFTQGLGLNLFFVRLVRTYPDMAMPNVEIGSIYGCFPGCVMNGGRAVVRERTSEKDIERTFSILAEYELIPRITCTNMLATRETLQDEYFNTILRIGAKYTAEVIVYSDMVRDYVRDTYGLRTVLSTTRGITSLDEFNECARDYDYAVLDFNVHKDPAFLSGLAEPEKAEIMVNEFCMKGCTHRREHYLHNSQDQIDSTLTPFECKANKASFFEHKPGHPVIFTTEEVQKTHDTYHIPYFKIVGRGTPFETNLEALTYYLIKPAARAQARALVAEAMRTQRS